MDIPAVEQWYRSYLDDFISLARGDRDDLALVLRHYDTPLRMVTDEGSQLLDETQLRAHMGAQVDALRADGYRSSDLLDSDTTVLNRFCATHRARVVRVRADGSEIARLQATYLVTGGPEGHRIVALVAHSTS